MHPINHFPGPRHGKLTATLRGTVYKTTPEKRVFFGLIRSAYPSIRIELDDEPWYQFADLLNKGNIFADPQKYLRVFWTNGPVPAENARVWVRFAYAGMLEGALTGAHSLSVVSVEPIKDERATKEDEILDPQPLLPQLAVAG